MKVQLGDIAEVTSGQAAPQERTVFGETGYPFVRAGSLEHLCNGGDYKQLEYIEAEQATRYNLRLFPKGTVVFAKSGMSAKLGRVYVLTQPSYVVSHLATIIPKDSVDSQYLMYFLVKNSPADLIANDSYPSIRLSEIETIDIDLPSIDEQHKVIFVLDHICKLISLRKQQLAKLDELTKSRFVEMFGDPEVNPCKFNKTKLCNLISVSPQNGLYKPQSDYVSDPCHGNPILRIDAFYNGKITDIYSLKRLICSRTEIERYRLLKNDIVINRVNSMEYLGKCAIIPDLPEETVFESNMMRFHVDENIVNPIYVNFFLCTEYIKKQITACAKQAVNQASINQKDVQNFIVLVPDLYMQNQFAAFVAQTEKTKNAIKQSLHHLETLKQSLMQEFFA